MSEGALLAPPHFRTRKYPYLLLSIARGSTLGTLDVGERGGEVYLAIGKR